MKSISTSILVVGALLLMFVPAFAGTQKKADFKLVDPAMLAGVKLMPGHYMVQWQADESRSPVTILKDGKTVVSTTALVVDKNDPYESTALGFKTAKNGNTELERIYLSKESLIFNQ